eukprot:g15629.t1
MREYFALPEEVKSQHHIKPGGFTRGYIGIGAESGGASFEVKEGFSYGYDWGETPPKNGLQGPNVFPDPSLLSAGWAASLHLHFRSMVEVSELICRALSLSLHLDENSLSSYCRDGATISLMRLFRYLPYSTVPQAVGKNVIGSSPHTDWGFLTLICQDQPGLELCLEEASSDSQRVPTASWHRIPVLPGTILVNLGDYLSLLTSGRYISPLHRVVNLQQERLSTVFFYYPDYDSKIPLLGEQQHSTVGADVGSATSLQTRDVSGRISLFAQQRTSGAEQVSDDTTTATAMLAGSFGDYIKEKWDQARRNAHHYSVRSDTALLFVFNLTLTSTSFQCVSATWTSGYIQELHFFWVLTAKESISRRRRLIDSEAVPSIVAFTLNAYLL